MESDFLVALRLQQEIDKEMLVKAMNKPPAIVGNKDGKRFLYETPGSSGSGGGQQTPSPSEMSLVDEAWEFMDPNPDIRALFIQFNERFFYGRLSGVEVRWSPRMTLCAGICCYEGGGGLCSVRLSQPLLKLRPRKDLIETLLHEMIHAYLFVTDNNKDHDGHGPEFHKHMYRINGEAGTNISVYHSFHDEVDHHRQHWWRCDGICRSQQPYFGYVKRSMNRAPHPRDPWWPDHQRKCGGTYTKVKEPEDYKKKKEAKSSTDKKKEDDSGKAGKNARDIRNFFGGKSAEGSGSKGNSKTSSASGSSNTQNGENPSYSSTSEKSDDPPKLPAMFPGQGFSLDKSWGGNAENSNNKIIRKIPGIGVIECNGPSQSQPVTASSNAMGDKGIKRIHLSTDTDSDTDDILDNLRAKAKSDPKRQKVKGNKTLDNFVSFSPGKGKKVDGFRSVCNSTSTDNDGASWLSSNRIRRGSGSPSTSQKRPVRDRDRRAIDLGPDSSESEDEEEENRSLSSAFQAGNSSKSEQEFSSPDHKSVAKKVPKVRAPPSSSVPQRDDVSEVVVIPDDDNGEVSASHSGSLVSPNYGDPLRTCPSCMQEVRESQIHSHLDLCLQML